MDHRHVLFFDPLKIEGVEIGAETVGHAKFELRRCVPLIRPKDPAATLFAHIPFCVGVAQDRMLAVGFAVLDKGRIGLGHDILVLDRHGGDVAANHGGGALGMVAGGGHDMLAGDVEGLVRGDQVPALLDHLHAFDDPFAVYPLEPVDLDLANDFDAALTGALGHRHRHVGGVYVAVGRVIDRALQILGAHQRPAILDLGRCHPFVRDADAFRR